MLTVRDSGDGTTDRGCVRPLALSWETLFPPYVHAVKRSEHPNHGRGRAEPHGEVVGEASTVAEALTRLDSAKPDVAVVDLFLPDGDGSGV